MRSSFLSTTQMEDSLSRAPSFSDSSQRLLSYLSATSINALSSSSTSLHLLTVGLQVQEPPLKRMKLETPIQSSNDLLSHAAHAGTSTAGGMGSSNSISSAVSMSAAGISSARSSTNTAPKGDIPSLQQQQLQGQVADAVGLIADSDRSGAITPPKPVLLEKDESKVGVDSSQKGVVSPDHHSGNSSSSTTATATTMALEQATKASLSMTLEAPPPESAVAAVVVVAPPVPLLLEASAVAPPVPVSAQRTTDTTTQKATTMQHLRKKYSQELEYMLREFQKLERQLLGAKGPSEESAGSRERREKLHSFIQHLEDTVRQIESGCQIKSQLEGKAGEGAAEENTETKALAGDSTSVALTTTTTTTTTLSKEKEEEEENVQKLEEHILANLLPVKVRLKKQLAAQQGAKYNPATMPHNANAGIGQKNTDKGAFMTTAATTNVATSSAAVPATADMEDHDQWRKQVQQASVSAEAKTLTEEQPVVPVEQDQTQFGKPLAGGGSSLTQKLHGQTLGSTARRHGHGVGTSSQNCAGGRKKSEAGQRPKLYFAGMAGSTGQINSSVSAASSVHNLLIKNPAILEMQVQKQDMEGDLFMPSTLQDFDRPDHVGSLNMPKGINNCEHELSLSDEQRHTLHRKRRKKKRLRQEARLQEMHRQRKTTLEHQIEPVLLPQGGGGAPKPRKKVASKGKKGGPRPVEYMCALCNECYSSKCDDNPWWALAQHECSKCCKMQIPRIDIGAPANAIEYHPALLAHAEDITGGGAANAAAVAAAAAAAASASQIQASQMKAPSLISNMPAPATTVKYDGDLDSLGSDISNDESDRLSLSDDDSLHSAEFDAEAAASMSPSEQAENERFGGEYEGPTLTHSQASRLLILMAHASTCPGRHKSAKHGDACRNIKWMMLHVRDCPGTTSSYDVCPFVWCRKVKHLLFHLVSCTKPLCCAICAPAELDSNWDALKKLNDHRLKKFRKRLTAQWKVKAATGTFRSKSLVSGSETPVSSIDVQDHAVCNTMAPVRSPFDEPLFDALEVKIRITDTEDVDSTTSPLVGKSRHSSSPLFESSLFGADPDVLKVEESVVAVNGKQESHNSTMPPGEAEEFDRDAAACFDRESIIDAPFCQKEIDENQKDLLDKGSSEASSVKCTPVEEPLL